MILPTLRERKIGLYNKIINSA